MNEGCVLDYISGIEVNATPEEVEAVQVFAKQLVEDYKYPKDLIQTRPQYRVKARPSDTAKKYPVDIVVFKTNEKLEDEAFIIVECKKKNRKDGKTQLEDYLRFSKAFLGVWFNGDERLFIQKIEKNGKVEFETIPNIPQYGQRVEDIGKFKRKDLKVPHNLKVVFRTIRNYLAGNFTGATRDEELARELINLIFCKIYDERFTSDNEILEFRYGINEDLNEVKERILTLFNKVKEKYKEVFDKDDKINLDKNALAYIIGELQNYSLVDSERDVIAEAFETFIGYTLKGSQGQFFTPRNVVKLIVNIIKPKPEELIIDPACGSGGFLVESLRYKWQIVEEQGKKLNWSASAITEEKIATAIQTIKGIEKDNFLSKVTKAYMTIIGDGKGGIFCEDSLDKPIDWKKNTQNNIALGRFDVLLTNPPFGKDIKVIGESKLKQYDLSYQWKKNNDSFEKTSKLKKEESPQIIFIERSLQLLRDGGKLAIVLPETFLHAPKTSYVFEYLKRNNNISWIIDLPHNTFRPDCNAKCIVVILEKNIKQQEFINMAVAEEIGHNHQGKKIYRWDHKTNCIDTQRLWDDIPLILDEINNGFKKYCFKITASECENKKVYVPRYYWANKIAEIKEIAEKQNCELISIQQLIDEKIVRAFDGHGSPPAEYKGMGEIPYIRVKDIVNWEIYKDPTAKIPESIYLSKKGSNKTLKNKDIFYVRRGSYRIGSVAMASTFDLDVLLTREILVLRVIDQNNKYKITPYYLLYLLSHSLVAIQAKNKVLIETTLPNIADRWKELQLPIAKDIEERIKISDEIESIITNKIEANKKIKEIENRFGLLTT